MLLRIIEATDGQYIGKCVEYNDIAKILTLPTGESMDVEEEIDEEGNYTLKNSNYIINATKTN